MLFYANGPEKHQSGTANEEQGKIAMDWKAAVGGFAPAQLSLSYETSDPVEAYNLKLELDRIKVA